MKKGWLTIVRTSRLLLLPPVILLKSTNNREASNRRGAAFIQVTLLTEPSLLYGISNELTPHESVTGLELLNAISLRIGWTNPRSIYVVRQKLNPSYR